MIRTAIHITEKQHEELRRESEETGLPMAELIRRAIDEFWKNVGKTNKQNKSDMTSAQPAR